jgi:hypothetical protein
MVDAPFYYARIGREFAKCDRWRATLLTKISSIKPDLVIFGSTFTSGFTQSQWTEGTARVLQSIAPASGHVYIMRSTPELAFDGPSCLEPRSRLYTALSPRAACTSPAHNERSDEVYLWLAHAARRFPNVSLLDMTDVVCPHGLCSAQRDGMIVFRDGQHLTASFAATLAPALEQRLMIASPHATPPSSDPAQAAPRQP